MTKNKLTLETTEEDFFEYMKFKDAVNRTAVFFYFDKCAGNERLIILDKPKTFEKINEKMKALEKDFYSQIQKNVDLKEDMAIKIGLKQGEIKKLIAENEDLRQQLQKKNKRWFEFWKK